jgi:single-stranded-DNA-specific exonuclease
LPDVDPSLPPRLSRELNVSPLMARVLAARGFHRSEEAFRYLQPALDDMAEPHRMLGMGAAVNRLARAIRSGEPVLLYGDYDVDGTTSIVILMKVLTMLGARVSYHVPHRLRDGYGMRPEVITEAAARGVRLIVSVDTGIRASAVVDHARQLGIDVIVTDHHLPEEQLPAAVAVLNPNQPGCPYPEKNLCGAGVAFKLAEALLAEFELPESQRRRWSESLLKMVAIATVADVVPLSGENRVIVKHGLTGLASSPNPGLRALLEVAGFASGVAPSAGQIAFRVAPRMNAAGRMDTARDVVELFLTVEESRARELALRLHALNAARQEEEHRMLEDVLAECARQPVSDSQLALVFAGAGWHKGVVGIVASRLVERFCRPVFVLGIDEVTGEASGSGRSAGGFHLLEALESMADLFIRFGGHRQAAGVTLPAERLAEFRMRLNRFAAARLSVSELVPVVDIDAVARVEEVTPQTAAEWEWLAPFGSGNPAPVLALLNATIPEPPVLMKERHLRFRLAQERRWISCKGWNWATRVECLPVEQRLDFAVSLEEDSFAGGMAAVLRDVRPAASVAM